MDDSVFLHPTAINDSASIGPRTRVWAYVHLQKGSRLGADCQMCDYSAIGFDTVVGNGVTVKEYAGIGQGTIVEDGVFIGPGVYTPNDSAPRSPRIPGLEQVRQRYTKTENWMQATRICRGASIGTGAIIAPGTTIGAFAMVGIGSIVTKDVAPHRFVTGHPARAIGWVCYCGFRLEQKSADAPWTCVECGRCFVVNAEGLMLPEKPEYALPE